MTFQTAAYAVDGNAESGNFLRLMLQSATLGSQGIVNAQDLLVGPTTPTASAGIVIAGGACVIAGAETAYQGSYYGYNVGNDTSLSIAATGGSIRSDMVIARAEDPTWSGTPWGGPASGQIIYPRVISGVSAGATTVPGGYSAIPLARIDMPASTSVVQASYIHDLRTVANPQQLMIMLANNASSPHASTAGTTNVQWPYGAIWSVAIPSWATTFVMSWTVSEVLWNGDGNGYVRGWVWPIFGASVTSPTLSTPQTIVSIPSATGPWRHTFSGGGTISIPASMRGTTQTLQFAQVADGTNTATLNYGEGSTAIIVGQFQQLASAS